MCPSHLLSFICRPLLGRRVFLDAGWLLSDSTQIAGKSTGVIEKYRRFQISIVDFLSLHASAFIWFESEEQLNRSIKKFRLNPKKCGISYTGYLECRSRSSERHDLKKDPNEPRNVPAKLFFRGKYNVEAGLDVLVKVIQNLSSEFNFVVATNISKPKELEVANLSWYSERLSDEDITRIYQESDACIGQLGTNPRLSFTIPHKAFEAAYFNKPYIAKSSPCLDEIFGSQGYIRLVSTDPELIAGELQKRFSDNTQVIKEILKHRYDNFLSNEVICEKFMFDLQKLLRSL